MNGYSFLRFEDWQREISKDKSCDTWVTVYEVYEKSSKNRDCLYATFCALMPNKECFIKKVLNNFEWEVHKDRLGYPTFYKKEESIYYSRYGEIYSDILFEPLVIWRYFYDIKESQIEISEEFRLYHNLYYDSRNNEFIYISKSGEEDVVVKIEEELDNVRIRIKIKYLRDFLAAKSMILVRFHNHIRYFKQDLSDIPQKPYEKIEKRGERYCFEITINFQPLVNLDNKIYSLFLGKDILYPFDEPLHEDYKYYRNDDKEERYLDFIIGIDENGNQIEYTCNPRMLSHTGKNKSIPDYLTPVYFKREVLKKYYDRPDKYTIKNGYIYCGSLWSISYGQLPSGVIHTWLGDLGRDLPYQEQYHWKQYNIPPENELSEAVVKRDLLAQPSMPDDITDRFKDKYIEFQKHWGNKFGWYLFLPLGSDDVHYLKYLHVPTSETPKEFEEQILALAKILTESINSEKLKEFVNEEIQGSIKLLEKYLISCFNLTEGEICNILEPLKDIQMLRSYAVVHRKGKKYNKNIKKKFEQQSYIQILQNLLKRIIEMFQVIININKN